jgi:heme exporter protein A
MGTVPCQTRGLGLNYGNRPILFGIELKVDCGGGLAIIGANGCGKSSLLKILAGIVVPTAGQVLIFGEDSRRLSAAARRRIGFLSHQSFLYPNLTARENLEFYARLCGIGRPREAAMAALERVEMSTVAQDRVRTVSRGMEQRLALARATIASPDLLLLDEPFAALDRTGQRLVRQMIDEARGRGAAVVITAHSPEGLTEMGFAIHEIARGGLRAWARESLLTLPRLAPVG